MYNKRLRTISTLLSAALILSAFCGTLQNESFLKPEGYSFEELMEQKDKDGKKRKLLNNKSM